MQRRTSNRDVFLGNYFSERDALTFEKTVTTLHIHKSDHEDVSEQIEKQFSIVTDLDRELTTDLDRENMLAAALSEDHWLVEFSTEADIQSKVACFIRDALRTLGKDMEVTIINESQIREGNKADIWIIRTKSGRPIAVCEVKCPVTYKDAGENKSILLHPQVQGQLFDYMVELRTMFGQCEVFGILTNLKEWVFCWFPDTDEAARHTLSSATTNDPSTVFPLKSALLSRRIVSRSKLYKLQDAEFPKSFLSVLLKSYKANFRPVPLLSTDRFYLTYSNKSFYWESISEANMKTKIMLRLPNRNTKRFKVLRFFHGGAIGVVFLAVTDNFNLVVVKTHDTEDSARNESQYWEKLYHSDVFYTQLRVDKSKQWGVIMPLSLHVIADSRVRSLKWQPNLVEWSKEQVTAASDTDLFDEWSRKLGDALKLRDISIAAAANQAIRVLANQGLVHTDLKWQHFAMMPKLDEEGTEILNMEPILIDLASVEKHEEGADSAYQVMKVELDNMCTEYNLQLEENL